MLSFIVAAALSTAPEMEAGIFNRRHGNNCCDPCCQPSCCQPTPCCGAPAPCTGCGSAPCGAPGSPCALAAPGAVAPANPELKKMPAGGDTAPMPKGDAPKGGTATAPAKAEAPIEIPANLRDAINKSDQKQQILDYLNNSAVPRDQRLQYLETVRQTLLPATKK